jgi:hypothetical protein
VVAVGRGAHLGVDIQEAADMPDVDGCISWIAHPEEVQPLQSLPLMARSRAVVEMWTAKEAFLKATGEGLTGDMRAVRVAAGGAGSGLTFVGRGRGSEWPLHRLSAPGVGMTAALVISPRSICRARLLFSFRGIGDVASALRDGNRTPRVHLRMPRCGC